jgi:hypothetical protein
VSETIASSETGQDNTESALTSPQKDNREDTGEWVESKLTTSDWNDDLPHPKSFMRDIRCTIFVLELLDLGWITFFDLNVGHDKIKLKLLCQFVEGKMLIQSFVIFE